MENKQKTIDIIYDILNQFKTLPLEKINSYLRYQEGYSELGFRLRSDNKDTRASLFIREKDYWHPYLAERKQKGINLRIGNEWNGIEHSGLFCEEVIITYNLLMERKNNQKAP